ncbi:uncharacterized protein LOC127161739 [Labeo rohita]|uniref:uncharacterized protein LOC127161739 n=1 Tax=Labeo rohita TaxID=84645 RepID=UPI0021E25CE0|nr:uncharacterized protein LOC127161739 [Labeo rohita]
MMRCSGFFREKNQLTLIAKIKGGIPNTYDGPDGIFKDSLDLEKQTGNLIIKNSTFKHAGCYEVKIRSSEGDTNKTFFVIIRGGFNVCNEDMYMMEEQEETVEYDEGIEGDSVHLITGLTEIPKDDEMQWLFRDENQQTSTIATIKGEINKTYDGPDGIFKDSLELEKQTGNLKIKNSKFKHAGCYKLKIHSSKGDTNKIKTYFVIIRDGEDPYVNVNEEETDGDSHYVDVNELRKDTGKRVNESKELKPLLNGEDVDVVNEQEGTSSL